MLNIAFLIFLVFSKMACASDMDDDFQQGLDAGTLHQKQAGQALQNFSPNTVFSNFNSSHLDTCIKNTSKVVNKGCVKRQVFCATLSNLLTILLR